MKNICYSAIEANINQAMKDGVQTITDTQRSSRAQSCGEGNVEYKVL